MQNFARPLSRHTSSPQQRLPASGGTALAAAALTQLAVGLEFSLTAVDKLADPHYLANFSSFVRSSPGTERGALSPLIQLLVLPHARLAATLVLMSELAVGSMLLLGALETGRRRLAGRPGAARGYERVVALLAALAALGSAGLSLSIFLLTCGAFPGVMPARDLTGAIPVELMLVPIGLSLAWMQFGRWGALRSAHPKGVTTPVLLLQTQNESV